MVSLGHDCIPSYLDRRGSQPLPSRGVIIPSYLGRGSSQPLTPRASHPPCPYIHNGFKPMHVNTPCLHTQWPKMRVCRGSAGGEGVGASGRGSAGLPAQMHQQSRGALTYVREVSSARPQGRPIPLAAPGLMLLNGHRRRPFEEKRCICYANDSMVEYTRCDWLIIGRAERCGKPCVNRLCGLHRLRRKPGSEPYPCRRCGKGTQGETQLCSKECGAYRGQKALHRVEARAKRIYPAVMHELLRVAERQRTLPFIGLRE